MRQIEMTAAQVEVIAAWSEQGESFVPLVVQTIPASYLLDWQNGDLLVTQGDAHLHIDATGTVKEVVPPALHGLTSAA
jgi:hypothetical protein